MTLEIYSNHLITETSPYLLQHVNNPVEWYPWGSLALDLARKQNKPILLSIGYSACHWCHVMAHESFENDKIASLMNNLFINIKVDREERPDLDKIYQTTQQMLTRRPGGWPLTMFLTPEEHIPFFGGTYFPPESRHGLPGFPEVLQRVADFYTTEKDAIEEQNNALLNAFVQMQSAKGPEESVAINEAPLHQCFRELGHAFDAENGGFSSAPKFPSPGNIERLLNHQEIFSEGNDQATSMAMYTLNKMADGGIYDHIGGGFCRYSVDHLWMIPHFEKMLYDNGPLLGLYTKAWRISGSSLYKKIATETAAWLIKEMQSPSGGFFSSLDADSEGEEGKFYAWTPEEIKTILTDDEYQLIKSVHGLDQTGNFEGRWHLFVNKSISDVVTDNNLDSQIANETYSRAREKLYQTRSLRTWPGRDEKILSSWNALAIKGLSIASLSFGKTEYLEAAERALEYIHKNHWKENRLLATSKDGKAHLNAYLDDYAFLIDACLSVLQTKWSGLWLEFAMQLASSLLELFYDTDRGGFYFTSHDHERLLQRRMDFMDDATPSGNGVAAASLARLGHLINDQQMVEASLKTLQRAWSEIERIPSAHQSMLLALEDACYPPAQIILRGDEEKMMIWRLDILEHLPIRSQIYTIPEGEQVLPTILHNMKSVNGVSAFVCEGFTCRPPITDLKELTNYLKQRKAQ